MITRRALAAWAGTDRIPLLAAHLDRLRALPVTKASAELALWVAGLEVDASLLPDLDPELADIVDDRARARVSMLPIGEALVVCDRPDAADSPDLVCWPDDSSFHLLHSIPPGRRSTWLDLCAGSAIAPLARPELADRRVVSDLNPRARAYQWLGAKTSRVKLDVISGDLATVPADLVTCNAPIPCDTPDAVIWRSAPADIVTRIFDATRAALRPGGLAVIHCVADEIPTVEGDVVTVVYTPADAECQFAITWWQPDGASRQIRAYRELTAERPHLDHMDRASAL